MFRVDCWPKLIIYQSQMDQSLLSIYIECQYWCFLIAGHSEFQNFGLCDPLPGDQAGLCGGDTQAVLHQIEHNDGG